MTNELNSPSDIAKMVALALQEDVADGDRLGRHLRDLPPDRARGDPGAHGRAVPRGSPRR